MRKLSKEQYLLACLSEECGEVVQVLGKISRFGLENIGHQKRGATQTNRERLKDELTDILAIMKLLQTNDILGFLSEDAMKAKQDKIEKYMKLSRELGTLEDE